ncbi:MAG: elongation factor Ts [Clostridia bacterium]|nr:elongation factor Ts [Clostridia bacterium]MBR7140757.1 elongation factor Ts [Clostridia bacterium]
MAFTAKDVAKLREQTGAGMMDCKKALTATDGDMDKAAEYLREQGVSIAAKKASRIASEGSVGAYTSVDGKVGALVEVNCESDFVANNADFTALVTAIAKQVVEENPADVDALLASPAQGEAGTVLDKINNATAKIGEKISLRRFTRMEVNGRVETYLHMGGKIGVLLGVEADEIVATNDAFITACHDIAMHIAAFSPKYTYNDEVPAEEVAHEKEILTAQIKNDPKTANKPQQVIEKMLEGRVKKFYKEVCLIDQDFVKDNTVTVSQHLNAVAKAAGATASIVKFERFVMGEGLAKKNEDFAAEIAKITNK